MYYLIFGLLSEILPTNFLGGFGWLWVDFRDFGYKFCEGVSSALHPAIGSTETTDVSEISEVSDVSTRKTVHSVIHTDNGQGVWIA